MKKEWVAHCTVQLFDGVSTLTSRPTETTEAKDEREAAEKIKRKIEKHYKKRGCEVNSVSFAILKSVN